MKEARNLRTEVELLQLDEAAARAERKLAYIIERYGDANGERLEPWYLAQLIAEEISISRLSQDLYDIMELQAQRTKKDSPCPKTQGRPSFHPYCTIAAP